MIVRPRIWLSLQWTDRGHVDDVESSLSTVSLSAAFCVKSQESGCRYSGLTEVIVVMMRGVVMVAKTREVVMVFCFWCQRL